MKNSRRNRRNEIAKAEKRAGGKPVLSKYEAKRSKPAPAPAPVKPPARGIDTR